MLVFITVSPIFGIVYCLMLISDSEWWQNRQKVKEERAAKPNIFVEYIRAKKRKICPLIEFTDD